MYAIFNDQNFNDTLTNDIVSFEQLGPGLFIIKQCEVTNFAKGGNLMYIPKDFFFFLLKLRFYYLNFENIYLFELPK